VAIAGSLPGHSGWDRAGLSPASLTSASPRTVTDLAVAAGLSVSATSHALAQLQNGGMVEARREGRYTYYGVTETAETGQLRQFIAPPLSRLRHRHRPAGKAARQPQP